MMRSRTLLAAIVIAAAAMRIYWNDIPSYSPADETVYTNDARYLLEHGVVRGYPDVVRWSLDDPKMWRYPNALRFGYLLLATAAVEMYGDGTPRALAWLSTLAGILVIPLLFFLGKRLFDERVGLLAAAFGAVSAIELALGRRALQDEVFCLAALVAFICAIAAFERGRTLDIALAVAAMTAAISIKESMLLLYPAFIGVAVVYKAWRPRHLLMFAIPPALDYLLFSILARDFTAFPRIASLVWGATASKYVVQYQAGPPHRILLDLFITTPFVSLLATAAIAVAILGQRREKSERALAIFVILAVAVMAVIPSKNLRFMVMIDPMVRVLAAWVVASPAAIGRAFSAASLGAVAIANAAIELELFHTIFVRGHVYDPVTQVLLETVGAVPRDDPAADHTMLFPWICAAIFLAAWLIERARRHTVRHAHG